MATIEFIVGLIMIAALVGSLFFMGLIGHLIVGPMDQAARNVQAPAQFFTVDLFGLAVLLQVATTPSAWITQASESQWNMAVTVGGFLWIATTAIWWASIRSLSRAGVGRPLKRLVFSTVVLPFAMGCIMGVTVGNLAMVMGITNELRIANGFNGAIWLQVCLLFGANLANAALIYGGRRTTLWILANPTLGRNAQSPPG